MSSVIVVRISTVVLPAAIVTPEAADTQLEPLKYWMVLPKSVPPVAEPSLNDGVKVMLDVDAALRLTLKTA